MVGFDQPAYAFDEDASTAQVCFQISLLGDLGPSVSPELGLSLMDIQTEGTYVGSLKKGKLWTIIAEVGWLK